MNRNIRRHSGQFPSRSCNCTPLHAFQIDFSSAASLSTFGIIQLLRGKWDVIRCQPSSVKCCCLHLSPDPASPGVCLHLPSADLYLSEPERTSVPEWSNFLALIFFWSYILANVSRAGSFGFSASPLTLQDIVEPHRLRSCRSAYVTFISPKYSPHHFFPLISSWLVILSPWTLGTDGKRRSWTSVPPSPPTHPGHHLTSALTLRPSAQTKSRLRSRLPAAMNYSGSHRVCLPSKCPLECRPGCLRGGRHLFSETMSKYTSAQDTPASLIKNK